VTDGTPPRVLVVTSGLRLGGAETFLTALLPRLANAERRVRVLSLTAPTPLAAPLTAAGIAVLGLDLPSPRGAGAMLAALRGRRFEVVLGWMYHGNLAALVGSRWLRASPPVVWSVHSSLDDWDLHSRSTRCVIRLGARWSRRTRAVCYVSDRGAEQHEALGYDGERREVVPIGIDVERFRPDSEARRRVRTEIGAADAEFVVGHFARHHPVKDQRTLLDAAGEAARRGAPVRLLLAGAGLDPTNRELRAWVNAAGLEGRVSCLGPRADLPRLLAGCDVVASTSRAEGVPMMLAEAMAVGIPCVATDVGGCRDLIGETGMLVPPGQVAAVAQALVDLWADGSRRRELGRAARRRVEDRFGIDRAVERYESVLERAAARITVSRPPG
jgi:glycosyltransferase involved in cell wall biosynthesis